MNKLFFLSWTDKTDREKDRQGRSEIQTVFEKTCVTSFPVFVVVFIFVFVCVFVFVFGIEKDRQKRRRKRQIRSDKDTDGGWENICNEFLFLCGCSCPCLCLCQNRQRKRQTRLGKGTDGGWENTCNGFPWICDRIWSDPCDFSSHFIHCQMKYYNNHTLLDQFVIERQNQTISSHYRCITLRTVWVSVRMFVFVFACVSDVSTCVCVCAYLCVFVVCIFAGLFCLCALNFHSKMKESYLHFARTKKTQIFSRMKNKTG